MFNRLQWLKITITAAILLHFIPILSPGSNPNHPLTSNLISGIAISRADDADDRDYLGELNAPILKITPKNKSYESYFEAWMKLNLNDPRAIKPGSDITYGSPSLKDAIAWITEPSQQDAVNILLDKDGNNPNITFRKAFGLPYGTRDIPTEMESKQFAVYIKDDILGNADFAYFPAYSQLWYALRVNAHHEAEMVRAGKQSDMSTAVNSLVAAMHMGRQLCDRAFVNEMKSGMGMVVATFMEIRAFMWNYRDVLQQKDYKKLAEEMELLDLDIIKAPSANKLIGDQLVSQIFGKDLRPNREVFAKTMAQFESHNHPLQRFSATAKWRDLMPQHATYNETRNEIAVVAGDIRLHWRFAYNDPDLTTPFEIKTISPVRYAIPRAIFRGIEDLFPLRQDMIVKQHGVICAAGVAGYQKRDGGSLIMGKRATGAPIALKQIQPSFVLSEEMLSDPQDPDGNKLQYFVVTNREKIRTNVLKSFSINTPNGKVTLVEGWPVLYSLGWDGDDDEAKRYTTRIGEDGDFIFWPPVEIIAKEHK